MTSLVHLVILVVFCMGRRSIRPRASRGTTSTTLITWAAFTSSTRNLPDSSIYWTRRASKTRISNHHLYLAYSEVDKYESKKKIAWT